MRVSKKCIDREPCSFLLSLSPGRMPCVPSGEMLKVYSAKNYEDNVDLAKACATFVASNPALPEYTVIIQFIEDVFPNDSTTAVSAVLEAMFNIAIADIDCAISQNYLANTKEQNTEITALEVIGNTHSNYSYS